MSLVIASISLRKFSACLVRSEKDFELGKFCHAIDEIGDLLAEILLHIVIGDKRVLDRVMQKRGDDGGDIQLQLGQDGGHFQGMGEIGIARGTELLAMRRHGIDIGLVEQRLVGVRDHKPCTRSTRSVWRISRRRPRGRRPQGQRSIHGLCGNRAGNRWGTHSPII